MMTSTEGLLRRIGAGSNRTERLLSSHYSFSSAGTITQGDNLEELWEEDVWPPAGGSDDDIEKKKSSYLHPHVQPSSHSGKVRLSDGLGLSVVFADPVSRSLGLSFISTSRMIPRVGTPDGQGNKNVQAKSAPVNVPDWTKILGIHHNVNSNIFVADDDGVDEEERLPPHEYLAREQARSHVDATSVVEGVGRKLKGRDMSRVRNAVWTQTGFFG